MLTIAVEQTIYSAKAWERGRKIGDVRSWVNKGIVFFTIPDSTPRVPQKGDAYLNECDANRESGDVMFSRGGMGSKKRVIVSVLDGDELKTALATGTIDYEV